MQDFSANSYKIENFYANGGTRGYYEAQSATEVKCTGRVATPGEPSTPVPPAQCCTAVHLSSVSGQSNIELGVGGLRRMHGGGGAADNA